MLPIALLIDRDSRVTVRLEAICEEIGVHLLVADDATHARRLAAKVELAVLFLDLDQSPRQALRTLTDLQQETGSFSLLWISEAPSTENVERVRRSGAQGLVGKFAPPAEVARAVRAVLAGDHYFPGINTCPATPGAKSLRESERMLQAISSRGGQVH